MAITATAGTVSATIKPNRPSLADMQLHYPPKRISRDFLYNGKIKGSFTGGSCKTSGTNENCLAAQA
ncbi:MAG: hypothetical protein WKG03_21815, partial [Telluria sp.]